MSPGETTSAAAPERTGGAGLVAWLAGRQRGRWATCRGRWIKTVMTAALIVTGLSAWAVALVQPWTARPTDPSVITAGVVMDAAKVRLGLAGDRGIVTEYVPPSPKPLRRNPFDGPRPAVVGPPCVRTPSADPPAPSSVESPAVKSAVPSPAPSAAPPPTPQKVLETAKSLRLAVILITPTGERWAVINGERYREGDAVAGLEIVEIREGHVKLQQAGVICLLRMD